MREVWERKISCHLGIPDFVFCLHIKSSRLAAALFVFDDKLLTLLSAAQDKKDAFGRFVVVGQCMVLKP